MKRSRIFFSIGVVILITIFATTAIFAGTYRSPSKDATGDGTTMYNQLIEVQSSGSVGGGTCSPVYVGYIAWDLTSETATWQSASLNLFAYSATGGGPSYTFTLYPANNDTWSEGGGSDPGYDSNTVLATATADLSGASSSNMLPIAFASDELGSYFLNKKGGQASIAVVMTDGCGQVSGDVKIEDREGSGGSAPTSANEPDLVFYTGPVVNGSPTAVEVSAFKAESNSQSPYTNWPLIAGLFALAAVVVIGIGYGVRRSKQS